MNHLFFPFLLCIRMYHKSFLQLSTIKLIVLNIYSQLVQVKELKRKAGQRHERDKAEQVQLWQLPFNHWKLNFNISAEDSHRVILHTQLKKKKSHKEYQIGFYFCLCFYYHCLSSCARTDLTGKKKSVKALHLSLVGVYKINIIPPIGEKVRFIPRQAVVRQIKFLSIKICYWDFSVYI